MKSESVFLLSFTLHRSIHVVTNSNISFLWLSNIPLLTYTNSIHLLMDMWASLIVRLVKMLLGSTGSGGFTGEQIGYPLWYSWDSRVVHLVKNLPAMRETWV